MVRDPTVGKSISGTEHEKEAFERESLTWTVFLHVSVEMTTPGIHESSETKLTWPANKALGVALRG